jgi:long-chain acyl-CoA synthetase
LAASGKLLQEQVGEDLTTVLIMTQMTYASAIYFGLVPAIMTGATAVTAPTFDASLTLELIERFRCSFTIGLPSMMQFLIEEQTRKPRHVRSLHTFIAGGDSVPVSAQERFRDLFGIPVREGYGMTEIGVGNCQPGGRHPSGLYRQTLWRSGGPCGRRQRQRRARRQTGEIVLRSPAMFVGYWDNPAATAEMMSDEWFRTGDLGRRDVDGYFWFEGRKKEIIIHCGVNISPQEVEEAIYGHPAVLVAVVGMPVPAHGERVVASVSLREGRVAEEQELREHASQRLADFKVPEKILFLESLPKGLTGKVQRRTLKEMHPTAA